MTSSSACCVAYLPCFECYACSPVNRISHDTFAVVIADIEDQETRTDKNLMVLSMGEHPCFSSCIRNDLGVTFDIKSLSKRWRINKPWIWKANAQNSAMYESIGQAFTTDIENWPATIAQDSDAPKSHLELCTWADHQCQQEEHPIRTQVHNYTPYPAPLAIL